MQIAVNGIQLQPCLFQQRIELPGADAQQLPGSRCAEGRCNLLQSRPDIVNVGGCTERQRLHRVRDPHPGLALRTVTLVAVLASSAIARPETTKLLPKFPLPGHRLASDAAILAKRFRSRRAAQSLQNPRGLSHLASIMLLTSMSAIEDRIEGLEGGGDDYLVKPFALGELVARVNALGRRSTLLNDEVVLRVADLELHRMRREVKRNGQPITLQPREFKMLETLMRNKGQVITKTMFLREVWDFEFDLKTSIVSTNISRLRDKIDRPGDTPLIHTVRGVGYRINELH